MSTSWISLKVGRAGLLLATLARLSPPTAGQMPVDPRVNMAARQGAPVQFSTPVGPIGGMSYSRPTSPLLTANDIANLTASRGLALQSFAPIRDPLTFRANVGSGLLSNFRRDSMSPLSSAYDYGYRGQPYYDPSTTVPTVGFLRGVNIAPSQVQLPFGPPDSRLNPRINPFLKADITGLTPGPMADTMLPEAPLPRGTASSIFGPTPDLSTTPESRVPNVLMPIEPQHPWRLERMPEPDREDALIAPGTRRFDLRFQEQAPVQPLNEILRPELYGARVPPPQLGPIPQEPGATGVTALGPRETPDELPVPGALPRGPGLIIPPRQPTRAARPALTDARGLPGFDIFTDMQMAIALLTDPNPTWFREMQETLEQNPELQRQVGEQAAQNAEAFVQQMIATPLRSLAGAGPSALNEQLLRAESLMQLGRYAEAASRYQTATDVDPVNPLPQIGKANAFLAMGNYRSAADALLRSIALADSFPGLAPALFQRLDLASLLGGPEVVEERRADLREQLEQKETPELRFLLGYLEYHSGQKERGLENLRKAAANPLAPGEITRYPDTLIRELPGPAAPPAPPPQRTPGAATEGELRVLPSPPAEPEPGRRALVIPPHPSVPQPASQPAQ